MFKVMASCVSVCVLLASAAVAEERIVTLSVEEEAGVDRVNEPMTVGVPLPEGKARDAARLGLADASGKAIPCQVTEVCKWLDRSSVKWVHVTWNQSIKAKGKEQVTVVLRDAPASPSPSALKATINEKDGQVTVSNAWIKFIVRGPRFTGFESAWFDASGKGAFDDATQVVGGTGGGSKVIAEDKTFLSANDPEGKVEIEEQGPGRVVVKATGRHLGDGQAKALDYIVRFYAYADSPLVRISHTFVCAQGEKPVDCVLMDGLFFDVPTRLTGTKATFGTEKAPVAAEPPARALQDSSDHFAVTAGERTLADGKGKATKPMTTGWIDLAGGDRGLAVGLRWFWQMCPKSLAADKDGRISIGLFPGSERPLEAYMGISRTHYMTFLFHDGKVSGEQLNAFFAGTQRPLRAWAPGKYYCRDTHCFGWAIENDPALFRDDWPKVEQWNKLMRECLSLALATHDGHAWRKVVSDSYGIYAWGDQYHWDWPDWGNSPRQTPEWRLSWEGNYYDYPNSQLMAFLRTGDRTFLERFFPNAIQIGDVHTCNYHPQKARIGECRYCPPRNFVATDDGTVYVSTEFNHFKSQSVYAHWYLTGDRRSLDHCRMLANAVYANHDADSGWAARGIGAQMIGLWNAYELTLDPKYLKRMKEQAHRAMAECRTGKYKKGGGFIEGILTEGLVHYYWVSGDPKVIETFKEGLPKTNAKTQFPNMALCLAFMYRMTGDKQYADWAWTCLSKLKPSGRVHNPSCQFRGTHFALFFLSKASDGWQSPAWAKVPE